MAKKTGAETVYETIREMILSGELVPGQQITETDMADRCGYSRTPVREAIRRLEKEGLLEIIPNKGTFLRTITPWSANMAFEAASALEGMAARLCAEAIKNGELSPDSEHLKQVESYIRDMEKDLKEGNIRDWVTKDNLYHKGIIDLSGNSYLIREWTQIFDQLNQVLWLYTPNSVNKEESTQNHRRILELICEGREIDAQDAAIAHRMRVRNQIRTFL